MFQVGQTVTWTTRNKVYVGRVLARVDPGQYINTVIRKIKLGPTSYDWGSNKDWPPFKPEVSYLVHVEENNKVYWPKVSSLCLI